MTLRLGKAVLLGIAVGAIGVLVSLSPFVLELEEDAGLDWLFMLRGPVESPADVLLISIDGPSAEKLGLPDRPEAWPRKLHADLVSRLSQAGASVIVFDVLFRENRNIIDDQRFADAVAKAGNVVLFQYIDKDIVSLATDASTGSGKIITERLVSPITPLAEAAVGLGPFPLPVVPIKVSQFWAFNPGTGDTPTLPVIALQIHALDQYAAFISLLSELRPGAAAGLPASRSELLEARPLQETMGQIRHIFTADPQLGPEMLARLDEGFDGQERDRSNALLGSLIGMYLGADSYYLNFYGPSRSIKTMPYSEALQLGTAAGSNALPADLSGKAVFVGFSAVMQPDQKDAFYCAFSQPSGLNCSGVEIAATAFANLLNDDSVKPLSVPWHLVVLFFWGIVIATGFRLLSTMAAIVTGILAGPAYLGFATWQFQTVGIWLPVMVPLFFQIPIALFGAILWKYLQARAQRERIRTAFGYYLPANVVDQMADDATHVRSSSELVHGTCLVTDAEQYTTLSESMPPAELGALMNDYYEVLFREVDRHGGIVSDVVGDSMMALWTAPTAERESRENACRAALEISLAVEAFNRSKSPVALPTRIGLDSGQVLLGNIGAESHFEYRAVGDIVNTASRIQGLNKRLGSRLLASGATLAETSGIAYRELGIFLLAGKEKPVVVHELNAGRYNDSDWAELSESFAAALALFRDQDWAAANQRFAMIGERFRDEGASWFYRDLCQRYLDDGPPAIWDGAVRISEK